MKPRTRILIAALITVLVAVLATSLTPTTTASYSVNRPLPVSRQKLLDLQYNCVLNRNIVSGDASERTTKLNALDAGTLTVTALYQYYFAKADTEAGGYGLSQHNWLDRAYRCVSFHAPTQGDFDEWDGLFEYYTHAEMLQFFMYDGGWVNTVKPALEGLTLLESEWLRSDAAAKNIARGITTDYSIEDPYDWVYGYPFPVNNLTFKALGAFRRTGYQLPRTTPGGQSVGIPLLHTFEAANGFSQGLIVTKPILLALDQQVVEAEFRDIGATAILHTTSRVTRPNVYETPSVHVAALYSMILNSLPTEMHNGSQAAEEAYWNWGWANQVDGQGHICDNTYYSQFGQNCNTSTTDMFNQMDDVAYTETFLWLFLAPYYNGVTNPTSPKAIDVSGFYDISFDYAHPYTGIAGFTLYYHRHEPTTTYVRQSFVTEFAAVGNCYVGPNQKTACDAAHDFGQSFEMYILAGNIFRSMGAGNSTIQQKYDWLRENVFHGVEYDTGDVNSISPLQANPLPFLQYHYANTPRDFYNIVGTTRFNYALFQVEQPL